MLLVVLVSCISCINGSAGTDNLDSEVQTIASDKTYIDQMFAMWDESYTEE